MQLQLKLRCPSSYHKQKNNATTHVLVFRVLLFCAAIRREVRLARAGVMGEPLCFADSFLRRAREPVLLLASLLLRTGVCDDVLGSTEAALTRRLGCFGVRLTRF